MVNSVYAWRHDGTQLTGWPLSDRSYSDSSPTLADLDGDGKLEVVIGSGDRVDAWRYTGLPVSGWPSTTTGDLVHSSPTCMAAGERFFLTEVTATILNRRPGQ